MDVETRLSAIEQSLEAIQADLDDLRRIKEIVGGLRNIPGQDVEVEQDVRIDKGVRVDHNFRVGGRADFDQDVGVSGRADFFDVGVTNDSAVGRNLNVVHNFR